MAEVGAKQPAKALEDFRRARFLEPNAYEIPLAEGNIWMSSNPILATTAWRDALRRAGTERPGVYRVILRTLRRITRCRTLRGGDSVAPDLVVAYLGEVSGASFNRTLATFLKSDPELKSLSEPQKIAFFAMWSDRGDQEVLAGAITQHPDWLRWPCAAWPGIRRAQRFSRGFELVRQFGEPAALPRLSETASLEELKKRFYAAPEQLMRWATHFTANKSNKASWTTRSGLCGDLPSGQDAPSPFPFSLKPQAWAAKENWERAWTAWQEIGRPEALLANSACAAWAAAKRAIGTRNGEQLT